eukprot:10455682-Ditylum_brightwellii.AAC.1
MKYPYGGRSPKAKALSPTGALRGRRARALCGWRGNDRGAPAADAAGEARCSEPTQTLPGAAGC